MDSRRLKITADHRTSLIVDPADGRIPPLVPLSPERQKARAARADANARFNAGLPDDVSGHVAAGALHHPHRFAAVPADDLQQRFSHLPESRATWRSRPEMIHSARIIPLDGRPHLGKNLHQWLGDTRGHWDGNTLVVETTNFRTDDGVVFQNANPGDLPHHRTLHARRRRHAQLRVHGRGSEDVDEAVDGAHPVDEDRSGRADVRVRLPRRQLRHRPLPDRGARSREERGDVNEVNATPEKGDRCERVVAVSGPRCVLTSAPALGPSRVRRGVRREEAGQVYRARSRRWTGSIPTPGSTST